MSDPVTNIEIEDVLSSIRRLVSDEARANERSEKEVGFSSDVPPQPVELQEESAADTSQRAAEPDSSFASALVLTPALRIADEAEPSSAEPDRDTPDAATRDAQSAPTLILSNDENSDEIESNATPSQVEQMPENAPDQQESAEQEHVDDNPDTALDDAAPDDQTSVAPEGEDDAYHPEDAHDAEAADIDVDEEFQPSEEEVAEEPVTIEDKIAALEALISRTDADFEPDGTGDGANAGRAGTSLPWEDSEDSKEPRTSGFPTGNLPDPGQASQTAEFDDGAAAFERAHAEAVQDAQAELEDSASETLFNAVDTTNVLDEEALRDMVADIVRQELQGPLGERITRNVRKLVRREIYRALAANELD